MTIWAGVLLYLTIGSSLCAYLWHCGIVEAVANMLREEWGYIASDNIILIAAVVPVVVLWPLCVWHYLFSTNNDDGDEL